MWILNFIIRLFIIFLLHYTRKTLVSFTVIIGGVFVTSSGLSSMPTYIDLKCAHCTHCDFPLLLDFGYVFRVQPDCAAVCQHDLQQGYQGEDAGHFLSALYWDENNKGGVGGCFCGAKWFCKSQESFFVCSMVLE